MDIEGSPFHTPRPVLEVFTPTQLHLLWTHLNNGNTGTRFVLGLLKRDGTPGYFRQKKLSVERGISWALATVRGKKEDGKKVAFVPYSFNERHESVWGGFDFDAHDGNWPRARRFAEQATFALRRFEFAVIAEESGNGFHVWAIALKPKRVPVWRELLDEIAVKIGAPVEDGICELFPTLPKRADSLGKGMRVPGSWHPRRNDFAQIVASDCEHLFNFLSGNSPLVFSRSFSKEKQKSLSLLPPSGEDEASAGTWMTEALAEFSIKQSGQRHSRLERLTGYLFHQVGFAVARAAVTDQYRSKSVVTSATESEHLNEFRQLWEGLERLWLNELSDRERAALNALETQNERDAFRIIRSYAAKAAEEGRADFIIARDNLGSRLGITPQGAGKMRVKFCKQPVGILEQTASAIPNVACARYRWLLFDPNTADSPF